MELIEAILIDLMFFVVGVLIGYVVSLIQDCDK